MGTLLHLVSCEGVKFDLAHTIFAKQKQWILKKGLKCDKIYKFKNNTLKEIM